jgi:glycosyltransferase involved in cell wall biosynthesis
MGPDVQEEMPTVSVVLPTYRRPQKLVEAVESVAAQTYPDVELLVVDDASPTPARETLGDRSFGDLRVRIVRHETNRGANAARTTGIEESDGDVVAFIDDDDYWEPETVEAQVSQLRAGGDEVRVGLVGQRFTYDGEVVSVRVPEVEGDATSGLLRGATDGTFSSIAVERSAIEAAGLPDERFPSWQDREWLLRLSRHCRFAVDPRPLVVRRSGDDYLQISDEYEAKRDVSYPLFLEKHRETAAEHGLENELVAAMTLQLAGAALRNGYTDDARSLAWTVVRTDPAVPVAWLYLFLSSAGSRVYRTAVRAKRAAVRARR